ncbi:MAG: hypothetical protein IJ642_13120 [Oscillospiraceae bacterium]|nr:hypothetical protein [Oscillospiraceae bacterium]
MKLNKDQFAELFMQEFPDQKDKALEDIEFFGEVLGHVFYTNMLFHEPDLRKMLLTEENPVLIRKYCQFIERMWLDGDDAVINIVAVSLLEDLSDDELCWFHFGKYISEDFKRYINTEVIPNNILMTQVSPLPYAGKRKRYKPEKQ